VIEEVEEGQIPDPATQATEFLSLTTTAPPMPVVVKKRSLFEDAPITKPSSVFSSRFSAEPPKVVIPKKLEEDEDPFDAYMRQIEGEAVAQQAVAHPNFVTDQPMEDEEEEQVYESKNIFTMEDLQMLEEPEVEEDDERYRQQFLADFRRQKQVERAQEKIVFTGDDEEGDKYIGDFEKDEVEAESFLEREKRKADKKELKRVDHTLQQYIPITKDLYIETKEVSRLTDKEVAEFRKFNGDIKVRGLKCPRPISNWYQCGLPDKVLEVIERKQFAKPFPI
jgi:hypothetical protein